MRAFILSAALVLLFSCKDTPKVDVFWTDENSPQTIGKLVTNDLLSRQVFMYYSVGDVFSIHYAEACAGFGAARLAGFINDSVNILNIRNHYINFDTIRNTANHVDANVIGILPLELYLQTNYKQYLEQGIVLANKQWERPLPNGMTNQTRYWIDDIYMINSLQVQAYRATKNPIYLERAALETSAYIKKLQQPNGLFHHGSEASFFWGRGNGWVAAGIAELLLELPESNPYYKSIVDGYRKMMNALLQYQCEDGMWRQLIDKEEAWKETSSTAMFGYAITVGVKKGILNDKKFKPVYQKAWLSLVKYINQEGKISDVCTGTGQSKDINYYLNRPKVTGDLHGQAPILWFAYSLLMKN